MGLGPAIAPHGPTVISWLGLWVSHSKSRAPCLPLQLHSPPSISAEQANLSPTSGLYTC